MKIFSLLFIIVGILFLGFGGYQWFTSEKSQKDSLAEAHNLLKNRDSVEKSTQKTTAMTPAVPDDFSPSTSETVGMLHIPKLKSDLPIVEGTHGDELAKGVGYYKGTAPSHCKMTELFYQVIAILLFVEWVN